jgi:hypothetical protein
MKDWILSIANSVNRKEKRVQSLKDLTEVILTTLKKAINEDIENLNNEIYGGEAVLEVSDLDEKSFTITHVETKEITLVSFSPREELLDCAIGGTGKRVFISIKTDDKGEINYIESSGSRLSPDRLSQQLLEPLIKSAHKL